MTRLLTTEQTKALVKILKDCKYARFEFKEVENDFIEVTWHSQTVFKALNKGHDAWLVMHKDDLFIPV